MISFSQAVELALMANALSHVPTLSNQDVFFSTSVLVIRTQDIALFILSIYYIFKLGLVNYPSN
jgi:hypothetical protein